MCNCDDETSFEDLCENCLKYQEQIAWEMKRDYEKYSSHDDGGKLFDVREK